LKQLHRLIEQGLETLTLVESPSRGVLRVNQDREARDFRAAGAVERVGKQKSAIATTTEAPVYGEPA
jgi:hypothetical protein